MREQKKDPLYFISQFIVEKRNLFFFLFLLACVFSLFSSQWTLVETEITAYLDEDTNTSIGLARMEEEFITLGSAQVMLCNIDYPSAQFVAEELEQIAGVKSVDFDPENDYQGSYALLTVGFDGEEDDPVVLAAMEEIRSIVAPYDVAINTTVGTSYSSQLDSEMGVIMVIAVIIVVAVLLLTSKSFGEIPVLLVTFGVAALLNKGTHFIFGEISFVSNSVSIILQLALAIDYAIILCHRFAEERERYPAKEACTVALSKAIVEISSSSLTTVCGLLAMSFMSFGLGGDLSKVLIKSILISLFCVFTLMPGLLMVFSTAIDKTQHKNFVPSIAPLGRVIIKLRFVLFPLFLVGAGLATYYSLQTSYLFSSENAVTSNRSESQIQADRIKGVFGATNGLAIIVPSGEYEQEGALISALETYPEVDMVVGLANTEAMDGYMLTDSITSREFSELMDLDYEQAALLYAAYAIDDENYGKLINDTDSYALPLLDVVLFANEMVEEGYVTLDADLEEELREQSQEISSGQAQLESEDYSRLVVALDIPTEGEETFAFVDTLYQVVGEYFDDAILVGDPTSNLDLYDAFSLDNTVISILSALFVMVILLVTFGSVAVPVILILVIQSAIFMNFAFPYFQGASVFFIGYLVVSAIQMGANVDYAIVITNRYMTLRKSMDNRKAIVTALDESFATVLTSGTILASAGIVIQQVTTDGTIATVGECVGRGTIISMFLVIFILPQLLYLGTTLIDKTAFAIRFQKAETVKIGVLRANGRVKGYVSGYVDAQINGIIRGEVSAVVTQLETVPEQKAEPEQAEPEPMDAPEEVEV